MISKAVKVIQTIYKQRKTEHAFTNSCSNENEQRIAILTKTAFQRASSPARMISNLPYCGPARSFFVKHRVNQMTCILLILCEYTGCISSSCSYVEIPFRGITAEWVTTITQQIMQNNTQREDIAFQRDPTVTKAFNRSVTHRTEFSLRENFGRSWANLLAESKVGNLYEFLVKRKKNISRLQVFVDNLAFVNISDAFNNLASIIQRFF